MPNHIQKTKTRNIRGLGWEIISHPSIASYNPFLVLNIHLQNFKISIDSLFWNLGLMWRSWLLCLYFYEKCIHKLLEKRVLIGKRCYCCKTMPNHILKANTRKIWGLDWEILILRNISEILITNYNPFLVFSKYKMYNYKIQNWFFVLKFGSIWIKMVFINFSRQVH